MNAVRSVMTVFMSIIVWLSFIGWRWAGSLPSPKLEAARTVLVLIGLAAVGGMWLIWSAKPRQST